jgi:NADH:ubiquinone oxidoreductase subunit K
MNHLMQFSSSLQGYLAVGAILFSLGVFCVLTRKNAIGILLGIELILNAAGINFVAFSKFRTGLIDGQIVALFIMLIAAAEAAVALAVILRFYRLKQTIDADEASIMRN